jgi:DNA-binding CsgD family transcriptional regulator
VQRNAGARINRVELLGRVEERAAINGLLDSVRGGLSGTLVLRGEAGIGKTTLLAYTEDAAADLRVIRITGVESEMELGFAGLHRLLIPFLDGIEKLPVRQRDALGAAFGLVTATPADQFMVGMAVLTLLTDIAAELPLACIVDDAHWLDQETMAVLAFVGRRIQADRVALLFAVQDPPYRPEPLDGLPELPVVGLPDEPARELLSSAVSGELDHATASLIVRDTRGNPLALVELAGQLEADQLAGRSALPQPLPLGPRLEARFLRQVHTLPDQAQIFLLLVAADAETDGTRIWRAAERLGVTAEAADRAASADLVVLRPDVRFRHPLIRSAVYSGAPEADRRRVHKALAGVLTLEIDAARRAWHLAAAAAGPDENLAAELVRCGTRAASRGGWSAEAAFLARAAELTPDPQDRAERMLAAAEAGGNAGTPALAEKLLDAAAPGLLDPFSRARALALRGSIVRQSRPTEAVTMLIEAGKALQELSPRLARDALLAALDAQILAYDQTSESIEREIATAALALARTMETSPTMGDLLIEGFATRATFGYAEAVPILRKALSALCNDDIIPRESPRLSLLGSMAANDLWEDRQRAILLGKLAHTARDEGALFDLRANLLIHARSELMAGRFAEAEACLAEAHEVTLAIGKDVHVFSPTSAELLAWRGRDREARAAVATLTDISAATGVHIWLHIGSLALVVLDLGYGHYEEALNRARRVYDDDPVSLGNQALPEMAEAGVRGGDRDAAEAALERLNTRATASGTPWALGLLNRSRALLASDGDAERLYQKAIEELSRTTMATDLARAHLLYGEWLRRQNRRVDAREQLRAAHDSFASMGAEAFAQRAATELLATGESVRKRSVETNVDLTPQEAHIARLASQGATNPEIAGRLFLSASTVDYHLRKVYRKLSVSSRRQLEHALPGGSSG